MVTFSNVLKAHGLESIIPYAFSCSAVAAFISPLFAGSLADHHYSAERLLRWFSCATAGSLALTFFAIERQWGAGWVLAFLQLQALCSAPAWGLATVIVLASLRDPATEFGPIRVWATFGWMVAGWLLSFVLRAETSTVSGAAASVTWLLVAAITLRLPKVVPPVMNAGRSWRELLGLDALQLLRVPRHRTVFLAAALVSAPLAAFYPFAAMHLRELGETRVAAALSLGQFSEIATMYALGSLLRTVNFKWLLLAGIAFGVLRYLFFAQNTVVWLLAGIALHGLCYTLFFIPAQIYVDQQIDRSMQGRAQSLLTLMMSGVGVLVGSLGCGWWREACVQPSGTNWTLFWSVLCLLLSAAGVYFAIGYRESGEPECSR